MRPRKNRIAMFMYIRLNGQHHRTKHVNVP